MAIQPFWWVDQVALGAAAAGTLHFPISAGTIARIAKVRFDSLVPALNSFSIQSIRDHTGKSYSDARATDPIWSAMLVPSAIQPLPVMEFDPPIEIEGPGALDIAILTVGADTHRAVAIGSLEIL
uniref:Uncharacterized protein n=1 Tax=viral metagenome TaxID=1070528 RepID=A0A6H1ZZ00_9ZZZZ